MIDDDLLSSDRVIRWSKKPPFQIEETTLSTRETALLDFLRAEANQNLTPKEVVSRSPLGDVETMQVLSKLVATGVLELREPSPGLDLSSTLAGKVSAAAPAYPLAGALPMKLGRFDVDRLLAQGSMGAVLLARDPAIDREVAIKLVQTAAHLSPSQREKYRDRFYREASAAGQLVHPAIATIFDVGHADDGTPFLVMEYVKGETLGEILEKERLPLPDTLQIARDLLEALGFAHARGIVHRDVKPSNIIVTPERRAKIMDFGIAHVMGSELSAGGDLLGSPYYMAPEQLAKGPITARTDLFAFGIVLYRMLTGVLPFTGDSFAAVAHAILHEKPVPPERLNRMIPKGISKLVLHCLEKSPGDRAGIASEVLRALADAESGKIEVFGKPKPGRGRLIALAAALALVALAALWLQTPPPTPSPIEKALPIPPLTEVAPPPPAPEPTTTVKSQRSARVVAQPPAAPVEKPKPAADARVERPAPKPPEPKTEQRASGLTEADLFYEARLALERGELERSRATLEFLLARNPTFVGAAELYVEVTDQIWEARLPLAFRAKHKHRLGGCEGELSLASLGVRFQSPDHDWALRPEEIRVLERPEPATLIVETFEKDTLSLGKNKRYRFELETALTEEDWVRYQRLLK
jgi:serine/threonine protein kinase